MVINNEFRNKQFVSKSLNETGQAWQSFNWLHETLYIPKIAIVSKIRELFPLGEVIEISNNLYGFNFFSGFLSLLVLGVYTILTVDTGNDDDDSDSGSGGLMQPVN